MITTRDATERDLDGVALLVRAGSIAGLVLRRPKKELRKLIRAGMIVVALDGEAIIGVGVLDFYSRRLSELRTLYILPSYRGMGAGKKIISAITEKAKALKVKNLFTITLKEKKSWFLARGFKEDAHDFKIALFKKL